MNTVELVVFDIAGTIIEDHGEVLAAFSSALTASGISFRKEELKQFKGASKREVIRYFAERDRGDADSSRIVESTYRRFQEDLQRAYAEGPSPIAGAAKTFEWCKRRGIHIATTTGFYREICEMILERCGWHHLFSAIISSSDVRQGRPAPYMIFRAMEQTGVHDVRRVINVGDTPLDLQSGNNAGVCGVIGVLSGAHRREELEAEPHTHIVASVADLPELIAEEFQVQAIAVSPSK